ncbi:uncharacterized protein LOC114440048 [Parambassis ranga]|uniref:Uncharacterized protein LOC114440048 n=1 Tax=Parambassis ranga TaxID=210632 RepID=A0A6P7IV65_9TELE|nr:uncharacterized protein LOC114440048 [Parambassis ranga]
MSTADRLLDEIFSWIEQRESCAAKLRKLARELEELREKCNATECVGSSVAVAGAACLIGAGVLTLCTGGAAAPFLGVLGAAYTGVGATISVAAKITEHFISSDTMKDAQKVETKSDSIAKEIQRLFRKLKAEKKEVNHSADPDELDKHVMTEVMKAMARRMGLKDEINISYFIDDPYLNLGGGRGLGGLNPMFTAQMVALAGILSCFAFQLSGKKYKLLFAEGAEQLIKLISSNAFKTFLKGGAMVIGGAIGMGFALSEAIDNWKDLIKKNHVTEASQSLRDTADAIKKMTQTLREQLDSIKEALRELAEVKSIAENPQRSFSDQRELIKFVIKNCEDEVVRQWLRENSESKAFFNLIDIFNLVQKHIDEEDEEDHTNTVDITFVAHGAIENPMIPARCLLPLSSLKDVVLYSPWNCVLTADAAYGIATGKIMPWHRVFVCKARNSCRIPDEQHRPRNVPDGWNAMKKAEYQMIPNIVVAPLRIPKDGAWNRFEVLAGEHGQPGRNRIVIPFILPEGIKIVIPFFVVTLALSVVLIFSRFRATLHLAACLGKYNRNGRLDEASLNMQYSYAVDNTAMTCSYAMLRTPDGMLSGRLYRAFKDMFDRNTFQF